MLTTTTTTTTATPMPHTSAPILHPPTNKPDLVVMYVSLQNYILLILMNVVLLVTKWQFVYRIIRNSFSFFFYSHELLDKHPNSYFGNKILTAIDHIKPRQYITTISSYWFPLYSIIYAESFFFFLFKTISMTNTSICYNANNRRHF